MSVYIILALIFFSCAIIEKSIPKNNSTKIFSLFLCMTLVLFSALRYDVGADYNEYCKLYIEGGDFNEKGFKSLVTLFRNINSGQSGYFFFVAVLSIITIGNAYKFILKYSNAVLLSLLIFLCFGQYYLLTLNLLRQSVVIYLFCNFGISFIIKRKFLYYLFFVLFSFYFFHNTAILLMPLYFINRNISLKIKLVFLLAFCFMQKLIIYIIEISPYAIYLKFDFFAAKVTILQYFLFLLSVFFLYVDSKGRNQNRNEKYEVFANLNYLNLVFTLSMILFAGTPIMHICSRLSYYTMPIYIVLVPNYVQRTSLKNRFFLRFVVALFYLAIFIAAIRINGSTQHIVPYKTILG